MVVSFQTFYGSSAVDVDLHTHTHTHTLVFGFAYCLSSAFLRIPLSNLYLPLHAPDTQCLLISAVSRIRCMLMTPRPKEKHHFCHMVLDVRVMVMVMVMFSSWGYNVDGCLLICKHNPDETLKSKTNNQYYKKITKCRKKPTTFMQYPGKWKGPYNFVWVTKTSSKFCLPTYLYR